MLGPDNTLFTTLLANAKNLHRHHFVAKKWRHEEEEEVEREERRRFANVKRLIEQKVRSDTGLGISGIRWFGKKSPKWETVAQFFAQNNHLRQQMGQF